MARLLVWTSLWLCVTALLLCSLVSASESLDIDDSYTGSPEQRKQVLEFIQGKLASASGASARAGSESRPEALLSPSTAQRRSANAPAEDIAQARSIVASALDAWSSYNKFRHDNPRRNTYRSKDDPQNAKRDEPAGLPQPVVNSSIAEAAALLAEIDAAALAANGTLLKDYTKYDNILGRTEDRRGNSTKRAASSGYWLANKENLGAWPYNSDSSYKVFRNVQEYGAAGDGVTDDTAAINRAISDGGRCGSGCESSSATGAIVYFPPGTYLVSGSIVAYYYTQMIGDPIDIPTILAAPSFVGLGVISTDVYINGGNGSEWYIEQSNFYRQIRNFNVDITHASQTASIAAIHYQVAQATSIQNVYLLATIGGGTNQQGMYTENGSGGFLSDIAFEGGEYGLYGGNQQYSARNLNFFSCAVAIQLIWDWGWTWHAINIFNAWIGISLLASNDASPGAGSTTLIDSTFNSVSYGIITPVLQDHGAGVPSISLDNVAFASVNVAIQDISGNVLLAGSVGSVGSYTIGNVYAGSDEGQFSEGFTQEYPRVPGLTGYHAGSLPSADYFFQSMPQYTDVAIASVVQAKWMAKGDGVTDDTGALQALLDAVASLGQGHILYIDAGAYLVSGTLTVPSNTNIVGECWPLIVANSASPNFTDFLNPQPMFQVGATPGETGNVQIQQLLFTTKGPAGGLVAVEWNMLAASQGSAALWDSHVRIGGALGSDLQVAQCPTSTVNVACIAATLMMRVTRGASGYFENMWLWAADHDIDDPANTKVSVFVARGLLVESVDPSWFYGTAVEHATLYQYQFQEASNIVTTFIQTETPYYQPLPAIPAPFGETGTMGQFLGDPVEGDCWATGGGCDSAWGARIRRSTNITIYGAGFYSFFATYDRGCIQGHTCQQALLSLEYNYERVFIYNLVTIGAKNMLVGSNYVTNQTIAAAANQNGDIDPWWSTVGLIQASQTAHLDEATELAELDRDFPSLFWEYIFPGNKLSCDTIEQYLIVRETVRMANELLQVSNEYHDSAFNRFFVSPGNSTVKYDWGTYYDEGWSNLIYYQNALRNVLTATPKKPGWFSGKPQSCFQTTLSCRPIQPGKGTCDNPFVGAVREIYQLDEIRESITFCPGFWTARYSNDILKGNPQPVQKLGNRRVIPYTYEQILIHELTHCQYQLSWPPGKNIKDPSVIIDGVEQKVYGAKITSIYWAWSCVLNYGPEWCHTEPSIKVASALTAECYAWMYQNRFFANAWGWDDDGSPSSWDATLAIDPDPELYSGDPSGLIDDDGSDMNFTTPFCTPAGTDSYGTPILDCTFPAEAWDDWLVDQGYPCDCNEDGCSIYSPSCCADDSCPVCDCNDDGCTDSPDCCANSTCQWANGGGGGGNVNRLMSRNGTFGGVARRNLTASNSMRMMRRAPRRRVQGRQASTSCLS